MSIQAIILAFAIMFMATILDMTGSLDLAYQIMIGLMIVVVITVLMLGRTPDYDRARLATTSSR
jgi:K+-transporting ATPase A subunit